MLRSTATNRRRGFRLGTAGRALEIIQTPLYCIRCIFGGSVLLGLSAYIVFLCLQIFSPHSGSKVCLAKVPRSLGCVPVAEENLDLSAAETPILAEAESQGEEAVGAHALTHGAQTPMILVPVTLESEPAGPEACLTSCGFGGGGSPEAPFD